RFSASKSRGKSARRWSAVRWCSKARSLQFSPHCVPDAGRGMWRRPACSPETSVIPHVSHPARTAPKKEKTMSLDLEQDIKGMLPEKDFDRRDFIWTALGASAALAVSSPA